MEKEILPHGGKLINRVANQVQCKQSIEKSNYIKLTLNEREISDLYMLAIGAFSPLEGFISKDDYTSVVENMRLKNGVVWPIPVTLAVDKEKIKRFKEGDDIALMNSKGEVLGFLALEEIYTSDKKREAEIVYKTTNIEHPGVEYLYKQGEFFLGGKVTMIREPVHPEFKNFWFTPQQVRKTFRKNNWQKIVGFQTRNPVHRAHEFVIKTALEVVDGLFLNPLVGETKKDDIPADVRMKCYEVLIKKYFPPDRVFMGVYGGSMRYAGPREAILHAIVRKNFGCTHFIVGRDHAGVGNYYGPFDAQKIFDEFNPGELDITPLFFENAFYCKKCYEMRTVKTCPHTDDAHLSFSGSRVRELLKVGEIPPVEFTRPEIANVLLDWWQKEGNKQ